MKKLYVIASPDGRTPEQLAEVREQVRAGVEEGLAEDIVLVLPTEGIEGIAADIDAILKSDIVVSTLGSMYNRGCRVCNFAASEYIDGGVYEEDWVAEMIRQRRETRENEIYVEPVSDGGLNA